MAEERASSGHHHASIQGNDSIVLIIMVEPHRSVQDCGSITPISVAEPRYRQSTIQRQHYAHHHNGRPRLQATR